MFPTIKVTKTNQAKAKPAADAPLGFGQIFTDHMFIMDYEAGQGWINPRIEPYGPFAIEPSCMVLHYGQAVFEGMKAYMSPQDEILLFRPELNFKRLNHSNERMVIPAIDEAFCVHALKELLALEKDWIPRAADASLYIRPFIVAMDPFLGVRPAKQYRFMIILSPSGAYYPDGLNPVDIYVENDYVRAVPGGTGEAKTSGNYAASLLGQAKANERGFVQVLWLDGVERRYIEEVGAMNVFFVIDGKIVTPALNGSILPGITRQTVIELARKQGYEVLEDKLAIDQLANLYEQGKVSEVFGSGTAAVISPVGKLSYKGQEMVFNQGQIGPISQSFYDLITGVQFGKREDSYGWIVKV